MQWKEPQNTDKYFWTKHVAMKMRHYGLSEQKIKNVIRSPYRKEEGIVKNTIAVMQPIASQKNLSARAKPVNSDDKKGKKPWNSEIWVMFQIKKHKTGKDSERTVANLLNKQKQFKIISAWRFPGVSSERNPIPEEILAEIKSLV